MAIIALLRMTRGGVAIDAAGVREHRVHLLPGGEAFGARRRAGGQSPLDPDDGGQGDANRQALSTVHRADGNADTGGRYCKNLLNRLASCCGERGYIAGVIRNRR